MIQNSLYIFMSHTKIFSEEELEYDIRSIYTQQHDALHPRKLTAL